MKISVPELKKLVEEVIAEAKKKKEDLEEDHRPDGFVYDKNFDMSQPLGAYNLYRSQGPVNFGPFTGAGPKIDDRPYGAKNESALRTVLRGMIGEALMPDASSAWMGVVPPAVPAPRSAPKNMWEAAMHWYDFQGKGLGGKSSAASAANMVEKRLGFKDLKKDKNGAAGKAKKAAAGKK